MISKSALPATDVFWLRTTRFWRSCPSDSCFSSAPGQEMLAGDLLGLGLSKAIPAIPIQVQRPSISGPVPQQVGVLYDQLR